MNSAGGMLLRNVWPYLCVAVAFSNTAGFNTCPAPIILASSTHLLSSLTRPPVFTNYEISTSSADNIHTLFAIPSWNFLAYLAFWQRALHTVCCLQCPSSWVSIDRQNPPGDGVSSDLQSWS